MIANHRKHTDVNWQRREVEDELTQVAVGAADFVVLAFTIPIGIAIVYFTYLLITLLYRPSIW